MADYDDEEGDLYIRFEEAGNVEGEPSADGLVVVYRDDRNRIAAIDILNLAEL